MGSRFTRRHTVKCIGSLVIGVSLAGCANNGGGGDDGGGGSSGGGGTVEMTDDLVYDPGQLTVNVGETVVWENVGSTGHTVTAYEEQIPNDAEYFASGDFDSEQAARDAYTPGNPDSGDIAGGESYEHTFETPGTYEYFCVPHESADMIGTVDVQEE